MKRLTISIGALAGLALAGCFEGLWLEGRPCESDPDCGPELFCSQGFCGGPQCPIDALENGVCPCPGPSNWSCAQLAPATQRKIDVLLVLDDASSSLWNDQTRMLAVGDALMSALDETLADFRIGITTTDMGNPACGETTPPNGRLLFSSCRNRVWDFVHDEDDVRQDCFDACPHDTIMTEATALDGDADNVAPRPWLQGNAAQTNTGEIPPREALSCVLPQGIAGCQFPQPLEAVHAAIDRTQDAGDGGFGFLRDDAHLLVLVVTDGVDCSTQDVSIFDPQGAKTFWSDPMANAATQAVCWNAGVACSGGPGTYDDCTPADLAADGSAAGPGESVLHALSRYEDRLKEVRDAKQTLDPSLQVVVAAMTGVPEAYPADPIVYADPQDATFADAYGIAPGCGLTDGPFALPPVRLRSLAASFAPDPLPDGQSNLSSACAKEPTHAADAVRALLPVGLDPVCVDACVEDHVLSVPGVQPECEVAWIDDDRLVEIPHCAFANGQPTITGDDTLCYYELYADQVTDDCKATGANLQLGFMTGPGARPPGPIFASCEPSPAPEEECPDYALPEE